MSTLFLEFNDEYLSEVLAGLIKENITVDYLITNRPVLYRGKQFKKTTVIQDEDFSFPEKILKLNIGNKNSLTKKEILSYLSAEKLYLSISDRLCFYPKTVQFRQQMYYELLLFWTSFIRTKNISAIIFPRVPHLGYGNIVYEIAKVLKIQIVIIRDITIDGKARISSNFLKKEKVPVNFAHGKNSEELTSALSPEFKNILELRSSLLSRNSSDNSATVAQNISGLLTLFDIKTLRAIINLIHFPWTQYHPSVFNFESRRTWFDYYLSLFFYYFSNQKLWKKYLSLSKVVDLSQKYIYFGLHYQPERTSLPEADIFENQLLVIDILSKSLPKGMWLYVKEHPYQFSRSDTRQTNFRDTWYYEKIASYENVKLVKITTPAKDLLLNSKAAVTLTGSTGLEALVIGKPVITFTPAAWYAACRSCFVVETQGQVKKALKSILVAKSSSVRLDLLKFLVSFQDKCINSATESFSIGASDSIDLLRDNLIKELKQRLKPKMDLS